MILSDEELALIFALAEWRVLVSKRYHYRAFESHAVMDRHWRYVVEDVSFTLVNLRPH